VRVLVTKVDPVAGIEKRGDQFQERIMVALGKTGAEPTLDPSEKVHIIAHSMGGLDARYLLSKNANGIADYVSTLTTIGTPHQGLADFCYSLLDGESNIPFMGTLVGTLEKGVREVLDVLDIIDGMKDLTTSSMRAFTRNIRITKTSSISALPGRAVMIHPQKPAKRFYQPMLTSRQRPERKNQTMAWYRFLPPVAKVGKGLVSLGPSIISRKSDIISTSAWTSSIRKLFIFASTKKLWSSYGRSRCKKTQGKAPRLQGFIPRSGRGL
jgi:hypothetical protein